MDNPIERVLVAPSFSRGFLFQWDVALEFADPAPWSFWVQSGQTLEGPWEDMSPEIVGAYGWQQSEGMLLPKDPILFFRIRLQTPKGEYFSDVRTPTGDLNRTDFLQAREIMRNEVVQARGKAGIIGKIWIKGVHGPRCTECVDPITRAVVDPDCDSCQGTGRQSGYHGAYDAWMTFSPRQRNKGLKGDQLGVHEDYVHTVRMIGCPVVKKDDVLVDPNSDRRYYVNMVQNTMELRRIPLIQTIEAREAPTSEHIYRLGNEDND